MDSPSVATIDVSHERASSRVAINFIWNLLGKGWSGIVSLVYVPVLVHGLGNDIYGIFSIGVVILSYFKFLELGFGRAVEKYGAEAIGAGKTEKIKEYFWTAFPLQLIVGLLTTISIWIIAPSIVGLLKIAPSNLSEAIMTVRLLALNLGLTIAASTPAGVIRAFQRFGALNAFNAITQTLLACGYVAVIWLGFGLVQVMFVTLLESVASLLLLFVYAIRLLGGTLTIQFSQAALRKLVRFGGFLTLSGLLTPVLVNGEKLLMGVLLSMEAVTFYTVPAKVLDQFRFVPAALSGALFPHLNVLGGEGAHESMRRINWRATELMGWMLIPFFSMIAIAGDALLALWIGSDFAQNAGWVLKILAAGTFVNLLATNSFVLIQARGRPEFQTIFYVVELIVYLPLAYFLMSWVGIVGAALAWTARVSLDAVLMWAFANKLVADSWRRLPLLNWKAALAGLLVIFFGVMVSSLLDSRWETIGLGALVAVFLFGIGWFYVLDHKIRYRLVDGVMRRLATVNIR